MKAVVGDRVVRQALHRRLVNHHDDPQTLVVDELGLHHGRCRVDIAVINGCLHGFEIKSEADNLVRLSTQVLVYGEVLDRVSLVVAEKHFDAAKAMVPDWWGLTAISVGPRGGIRFLMDRRPRINRALNAVSVAQLLWHGEAAAILAAKGMPGAFLRKSRAYLYRALAEILDLDELRHVVRQQLRARVRWRDRGVQPRSSDGSYQPTPTS